jgi:hypothetical protein
MAVFVTSETIYKLSYKWQSSILITTEKLALESKYIIAIVCGIGAVFIIIFIVICVVCKRRRKEHDNINSM